MNENELTEIERLWIAERLMSRAKDKMHDLRRLKDRAPNPGLVQQLSDDIAECTRIALKLMGKAAA